MLRLGDDASNGFFVRPTIFEGVGEDSRLMREELFGSVVAINTIFTETEAIEKANNSALGLYAAVFIKDLDRAVRLAKALDAGTVGVNCTSPTNARDTAFGGFKMSGTVREGFCIVLTISLRVS
jgi:aldehyde dehydrogenase (NAD+)